MKPVLPVHVEAHEFRTRDFVGGHPVLDFVNTVTGWNNTPRDWLDSYERLAGWAQKVGVISTSKAAALKRKAWDLPGEADAALDKARSLRTLLHAYFTAIATGRKPPPAVIERFYSQWRESAAAHAPELRNGCLVLELVNGDDRLGVITDRLAVIAFELAQNVDPIRLRQCDGANCGWLFLDRSKAGRRRWCDMATCGNAAKARRYQRRNSSQ